MDGDKPPCTQKIYEEPKNQAEVDTGRLKSATTRLGSRVKPMATRGVYLAVDDGGEGQVVEDLGAVSPHGDRAVLAEALVIEAVDLGDLPRLVVPPDQRYPVWVAHLRSSTHKRGISCCCFCGCCYYLCCNNVREVRKENHTTHLHLKS